MQYDESEYFTDSAEEIAAREEQEALRRLVRTEIRRVHTGAAAEDIAEDIRREEQEATLNEPKKIPRWIAMVGGALTGEILLSERMQKAYGLMVAMGIVFFVSIVLIFASLRSDLTHNNLVKEVERLKDMAVRTSEKCHQATSHSEIVRRLRERGIPLEDPTTQPKYIE
jgi:hypothetical protein